MEGLANVKAVIIFVIYTGIKSTHLNFHSVIFSYVSIKLGKMNNKKRNLINRYMHT